PAMHHPRKIDPRRRHPRIVEAEILSETRDHLEAISRPISGAILMNHGQIAVGRGSTAKSIKDGVANSICATAVRETMCEDLVGIEGQGVHPVFFSCRLAPRFENCNKVPNSETLS